jgi:FMN phosphatase YigB (HAD superfamily)
MKDIILFDLDNTLADMDHRLHLINRAEPDWDTFERACIHDSPIPATIKTTQALTHMGLQVWVWTGRSDLVLHETKQWLAAHQVSYIQLLMRPYGDIRPTSSVKLEWLADSPVPRDRVLCAYDDDPRVVSVLREAGLDVLHVRRRKDADDPSR